MSLTPTTLAARLAELASPENHPEREGLVLECLGDVSAPVREVAVAWAARVLEPEILVPLVAEGADALLRNAALAALERQGPYARTAVERAVGSADADLAMFSCQVLASIGGASSVPALLQALKRSEVNIVQAATEALGRLRRPEAVPALVGLLQREAWLQLAATDALGEIGDPGATGPLLSLVPDTLMAEPALDALARIASPSALPRLLSLLLNPLNRRLRSHLLRAVGAILGVARSGQGVSGVDDQLSTGRTIEADHGEDSVWQFLAERLGGQEEELRLSPTPGDDRARVRTAGATLQSAVALVLAGGITSLMPLLVRWAEEKEGRTWMEPLALRWQPRLLPLAGALLAHPDPAVRAGTLWLVPPASVGAAAVRAALDDPSESVRIAACQAARVLADPTMADRLAELLDLGGQHERVAAASALVRVPEASQAILEARLQLTTDDAILVAVLDALAQSHSPALEEKVMQLAGQVSGSIRRAALRAVASIPGSRAEVLLLRALADRDPGLQVEALDLLVLRGGDRVRTTLLALLGVGDSLRYHVIRALGRLGNTDSVQPLRTLFGTAPLHERIEILMALARLGGPAAREFLGQCMDNTQPEIRRAAAQGLASLAEKSDLELLSQLARDRDWVVRSEAATALGRLGAGGRPVLLDLARDLEPVVARTARAALVER